MSSNPNPGQSFFISWPGCDLTIEQIWPDGNAPENPTAEDVAKVMAEAGWFSVLNEWELIDEFDVCGHHSVATVSRFGKVESR